MAQFVARSDKDGVRTLTLDRPEQRNALTPQMQDELIAELEAITDDRSVRVMVLTGAGGAFCAGLDLAELQKMGDKSAEELEADGKRVARMFQALYQVPVPTIAAVNGHAIAGGTGLATICDFTYAVEFAQFGYTEVKIGFVPAVVSAYLTMQVGEKRARELLLTGRLFSAEEAMRMGLVTEIAMDLWSHVERLCELLKNNSPASLRATKRLVEGQNREWLEKSIANAMTVSAQIRGTDDFHEGIAAFFEKRKPVWK